MSDTLEKSADRLIELANRQAARIEELEAQIISLKATLEGAEAIMRRAKTANDGALQIIRAALDEDAGK